MIVALQRLKGPYNDRFLVDFMKTLYSLSPSWTIQARLDRHILTACMSTRDLHERQPRRHRQLSMQW